VRRETACFDLATNCRQTNIVLMRELIERIGSLHVALLSRQLKNQVLSRKFQHGTILMFNGTRELVGKRQSAPAAILGVQKSENSD
jgi:hypothetical protein